jgi:hypothetical protein
MRSAGFHLAVVAIVPTVSRLAHADDPKPDAVLKQPGSTIGTSS